MEARLTHTKAMVSHPFRLKGGLTLRHAVGRHAPYLRATIKPHARRMRISHVVKVVADGSEGATVRCRVIGWACPIRDAPNLYLSLPGYVTNSSLFLMQKSPELSDTPFKKIMAANRGEIAVRITRAGLELGLQTVRCCCLMEVFVVGCADGVLVCSWQFIVTLIGFSRIDSKLMSRIRLGQRI